MISDKDYLGLTLVGEARGEPIEGIIGVANVIRNRVLTSKKTYKDICLAPKQFSCWNQDDLNYAFIQIVMNNLIQGNPIIDIFIRQCLAVARCVYEQDFRDNVHGSKNYVTQTRYNQAKERKNHDDTWILNMQPVITLGHHIFLI